MTAYGIVGVVEAAMFDKYNKYKYIHNVYPGDNFVYMVYKNVKTKR